MAMAEQVIIALAYAFALPLTYGALWIADLLRPIDVSMRRRLLLVVLSIVLTRPIVLLSPFLYPLIYLIDVLLIRWVYVDSWGGAAIRVLLWYLFVALLTIVLGILLAILAIALSIPFPAL
jgi:hypothetical protein